MSLGPNYKVTLLSRGLYHGKFVCLNCHTNAYMKLYVHEVGNVVMNTWFRCSNCDTGYAFPTQSHFLECPQCDGERLMWDYTEADGIKDQLGFTRTKRKILCDLCFGRKWARIRSGEIK